MKVNVSGKYISVTYDGVQYQLCNQRCRDWTHPYEYQGNGSMLTNAGCGIFAIANAACYLGGERVIPEELADFSCACGGRGDDGTDRPALLAAMQEKGLAEKYGFRYEFDGLRNDLDTLHAHLMNGGAALCNLRVGHIVALVGGRIAPDGEKQVLAADPYSESAEPKVIDAVRECVPGSEVISPIPNARGERAKGYLCSYALFWASLSTVRDFNLLHRIFPRK
ncbi:MAG: hypothetical protein Q4G00_03040 [Clostridia bacterium]|nr:hypothetical protein [Clostridia bacterium]